MRTVDQESAGKYFSYSQKTYCHNLLKGKYKNDYTIYLINGGLKGKRIGLHKKTMGFVDALPAGVTFFGRARSEPILFEIAYSYEQGTKHRKVPIYIFSD